jgi:tetratricopeptide (TPR) repeat protein
VADPAAILELERRLERYPPARYPVQRATALFHLGTLLTGNDPQRGLALLEESTALFERAGLALEAAKARNAVGVALRELGELYRAAAAFRACAAAFAAAGAEAEQGAALYNLGLVLRTGGDRAAAEPLERALALLPEGRARLAAARELAALLLEQDEPERAVQVLEREQPTKGDAAAANVLGLAYLATERYDDAVAALRSAAAGFPRSAHPREHAMAKANLALAHERAGRPAQARLCARQALATAEPDEAVRAQAHAVLGRLGDPPGDLARACANEPREGWPGLVREELSRWGGDRRAAEREAAAWVAAQDDERAEALLAALLELPPEPFQAVLGTVLAAGDEETRAQLERAASLFHAPQELRVREAIARLWTSSAT